MADQIYYSVFTKKGLELLTEAIQNGTKLGITSMAFGDGGGSLPVPNEAFTQLVNEVHRTQLNSLAPDPNNANWLRAEAIIASAVGGFNIRELGLYAGDVLVAYSNYPATYKPNPSDGTARIMTFRMILQIDNTSSFDLVIDPDVVLATIQFVNNQFNKAVSTVNSIDELLAISDPFDQQTVFVKSYHNGLNKGGGNFKYNSEKSDINDGVLVFNGWERQLRDSVIAPEMSGAYGEDQYDDLIALQKCADFLVNDENAKKYKIVGGLCYAVSDSLIINNLAYGARFELRSLVAHANFPEKTNYKTAKSLVQIGKENTDGGMVGLNIKFNYINGGGKATFLSLKGFGFGGSNIHVDRLENVVNGVEGIKPNWHSASNKITGGYWSNGTGYGILLEKGGAYVVEGWIIDVNFICEFKAPGIVLRNAQYANIRGQADFNGKYCAQITINESSFTNLVRDAVITDGTNSADVIAFYEFPKGTYNLLVYEGQATKNGSKFSVDSNLSTSNGFAASIKSIKLADVDNWYPDVVHDFTGDPFAKCIITMPYCGGLVGNLQHTSTIQWFNSALAKTNSVNGATFAHSGSILSMFDAYLDSVAFDITDKLFAPYRHLYMKDYRTYGVEVGLTLAQGVKAQAMSFTKRNDGTLTNVCENYQIYITTSFPEIFVKADVVVNAIGNISIFNVQSNGGYITLSATENKLFLEQNAQSVLPTLVTRNRIN